MRINIKVSYFFGLFFLFASCQDVYSQGGIAKRIFTDSFLQNKDSLFTAPQKLRIDFDKNVLCEGDSAQLSVTSSGVLIQPLIKWSTGDVGNKLLLKPSSEFKVWVDVYEALDPANLILSGTDTLMLYVTRKPMSYSILHDTVCKDEEAMIGLDVPGGAYFQWPTYGNTTDTINVFCDTSRAFPVRFSYYPIENISFKNACYQEDTAWVIVLQEPAFEILGPDAFCLNANASFQIKEGEDILWFDGSTEASISFLMNQDSLLLWAIATDKYACRGRKERMIYARTVPDARLELDKDTICRGDSFTARIVSESAEKVIWFNRSMEREITLSPKYTLLLWVEVFSPQSMGACSGILYDTVFVKECSNVRIPSAFKLAGNSKGIGPIGQEELYKNYYFAIYDRSGKLLFESREFSGTWDGKYKGKYVHPGVYVYFFRESHGEWERKETGTITVVQ